MTATADLDLLTDALAATRYLGVDEYAVQDGIAEILTRNGIDFEREKRLGPRERLDFAVGTTAIEVKVRTSRADLIRQLGRYAAHEEVEHIILASPSRRVLAGLPDQVYGVPIVGVLIRGGSR